MTYPPNGPGDGQPYNQPGNPQQQWGQQPGPQAWGQPQPGPQAWGQPQPGPQAWGQQPGYGQQGFPPPARKSKTGLIVGLIVAAVLVIGTVIGIVLLTGDDSDSSATGDTTGSDEEQIESAIKTFYSTWESKGYNAAVKLACTAARNDPEKEVDADTEKQLDTAEFDIQKVENIRIDGDLATADVTGTVTFDGQSDAGLDDMTEEYLAKEGGKWKVCDDPNK
ncbi:hypothetical protein [Antrihabitans spumae]|uniref:DUF4878 domain-containing protein n=1 Tax=Antrihabitans spumae TaxID=3373370 RepID=A0ABW7KFP6_9NOCA